MEVRLVQHDYFIVNLKGFDRQLGFALMIYAYIYLPHRWAIQASLCFRCDLTPDCKDGEDEEDCKESPTCKEKEFRCSTGSCINKLWTCDGVHDCEDGSDEKLDECTNVTCSSGEFVPPKKKCISIKKSCSLNEKCNILRGLISLNILPIH